MNETTTEEVADDWVLIDPEEFLRGTPLWRELQFDTIEADLRRVANAQGFEVVAIERVNSSVIRLTAYVGNENEQRTSLRCLSMVFGLLRSAGVSVRRDKVFARYRRSVIRSVFVPDWD